MTELRAGRTVKAFIVIFWLIMISALVYRNYGHIFHQETPVSMHGFLADLSGEQWMGIYYNDRKVGHSRWSLERKDSHFRVTEKSSISFGILGTQKKLETDLTAELDQNYSLLSFDFLLHGDADLNVSGNVADGKLHLVVRGIGWKSEQTIDIKEKPLLKASLAPMIRSKALRVGDKFRASFIDPGTLTREDISLEAVSEEIIKIGGKDISSTRLNGTFGGTDISLWVDNKGEILKEKSPLGFVFVKEDRESALAHFDTTPDLPDQLSIPFDLPITPATRYLKVRITGIDTGYFDINGGRQRLEGDVLEIRMDSLEGISAEKTESYDESDLRSTTFIQSDNPAIISLASKIIGKEKGTLLKARLINNWVYKNIIKAPSVTLPSAVDVLKSMRGDCNEHAALFTALARSSGIPTRISLGLAYNSGRFYYHAWPEVFFRRWIALDPTFGQFPADAAHIRLLIGDPDKQMRIIAAMEKIKLKGLNYK